MTRIKLFTLLAPMLLALLFASCNKQKPEVENPLISIVDGPFLNKKDASGRSILYFDTEGGTAEINFDATATWKVEVKGADWCIPSMKGGNPGKIKLVISVSANKTKDIRSAILTLKSGNSTTEIAIQQAAVIQGELN